MNDSSPLVVDDEARLASVIPSIDMAIELEKGVGGEDVEVGAHRGKLADCLEMLRQEDVVCIQHGDELRRRCKDRGVPGGRDSPVLLADQRDLPGVGLECLRKFVSRTV